MRFVPTTTRQKLLVLLVLLAVAAIFLSPLLDLPETVLRATQLIALMLCAILLLAQTIVALLHPRLSLPLRAEPAGHDTPPSAPPDPALLLTTVLLC